MNEKQSIFRVVDWATWGLRGWFWNSSEQLPARPNIHLPTTPDVTPLHTLATLVPHCATELYSCSNINLRTLRAWCISLASASAACAIPRDWPALHSDNLNLIQCTAHKVKLWSVKSAEVADASAAVLQLLQCGVCATTVSAADKKARGKGRLSVTRDGSEYGRRGEKKMVAIPHIPTSPLHPRMDHMDMVCWVGRKEVIWISK